MRCSAVRKLILISADFNLDPNQKRILENHLKLCSDCRSFLEGLHGIQGGFKRMPRYKLKACFRIEIRRAAQHELASGNSKSLVLSNMFSNIFSPPVMGTAAASLLLLAVGYLYRNSPNMEKANELMSKQKNSVILKQQESHSSKFSHSALSERDTTAADSLNEKGPNYTSPYDDVLKVPVGDRH